MFNTKTSNNPCTNITDYSPKDVSQNPLPVTPIVPTLSVASISSGQGSPEPTQTCNQTSASLGRASSISIDTTLQQLDSKSSTVVDTINQLSDTAYAIRTGQIT